MAHLMGCPRPEAIRDASHQLRCPSCKYIQPKPRGSSKATGYVCRDHHDQPVTWRGTGCTQCAADLKRRKATVPSDYTESEY